MGRPYKPLAPDDPRHGSANGYGNLGCRCKPCCAANTAHHYTYMHGDPTRMERHAARERARNAAKRRVSA